MNTSPASKRFILHSRAKLLAQVRDFFSRRNVLEVDCPSLSSAACIDQHIDVMSVDTGSGKGYLHTSPEYGMKRLLAEGSGDIYQLSHVFRANEKGPLHSPEFMMIEWYRIGFSFEKMIQETLECIQLFLGNLPCKTLSYKQLFFDFLQIDYEKAPSQELSEIGKKHGLCLCAAWDRDTLLQALLSLSIEPHLGQDHLFVLTHFPASQAALAQTRILKDNEHIALRFEIYHKGIELANGYQELTDSKEQRNRLIEANQKRISAGKESLPLDESFLQALEKGLPPCCGVAAGFDRLLQLSLAQATLHSVLPLS